MTKVTVGIPFRDDSGTLGAAIQSVLVQSLSDLELILLDDGSSDGSLEIARSVEDVRACVISDGVNRGLAARLNEITRVARGEFVFRMDADDLMFVDRLKEQVEVLERTGADLVCSPAIAMSEDAKIYGMKGDERLTNNPQQFMKNAVIVHPTVAATRDWMLAIPYDEHYRKSQDKELFCRTFATSNFVKSTAPLLFYREAGGFSMSSYHTTARMDRAIIRSYGPRLFGHRRTIQKIVSSFLKVGLYRVLKPTGVHHVLVSRRSRALSDSEAQLASIELVRLGRLSSSGK